MGQLASSAPDQAKMANGGSITAAGQSPTFSVDSGYFNFSVWGTFVATIVLQRSFDGGNTWLPISVSGAGGANSFTAPVSVVVIEPESGVLYSVDCTSYTSGTINWRASQ